MQPVLDRGRQGAFGRDTAGLDPAELAAAARALLRGRTLTRPQLGRLLAEHGRAAGWGERDPRALAWSVQCLVPVVHVPPNGTWGRGGATPFTLAEEWLDSPPEAEPSPGRTAEMVLRYLTAFGPAGVRDVQTWSGLTRLGDVLERLRPDLRVFHDEDGNELFDVPDGPLPAPATPAPPRFLPDFDNLMVAHARRARIMTDEHRRLVISGSLVRATLLVDGFVRGVWTVGRDGDAATLTVRLFEPLSAEDTAAVTAEGERLLAFAAPDAPGHHVRFA